MSRWITGDIHVHSNCCHDGSLPVAEIVKRAKPYCDFLAISGHARCSQDWGQPQYSHVLAARKQFPDIPIFHTGEIEFPIERHVMIFTHPDNREFELQRELVRKYDRRSGVEGIEAAEQELDFVHSHWGPDTFMVFNHPNAPDVALQDLQRLVRSPVFKVIACIDRGERRAEQIWEINGHWDRLLSDGARLYARFGSDFHKHFDDGGKDYYPGEFVQDHLLVENNSYRDIIDAYRHGRFFSTVDNVIAKPTFRFKPSDAPDTRSLELRFTANKPLENVQIISDGKLVRQFEDVPAGPFNFTGSVARGSYYRVRGTAPPQPRKYSEGQYQPVFIINPIFEADMPCS